MNKIFITVIIAALSMVGMQAQELKNNADSLGYFIGGSQGASFNKQSAELFNGEDLKNYRNDYLRGLKEAILADTVNTGLRDGQRAGELMLDEIIRMRNAGMPVNLELFYDTFAKYYTAAEVSEEEASALFGELKNLLEPMQRYYAQKQEEEIQRRKNAVQEMASRNMAAGKAFINNLKIKDKDVIMTESGLVYKVNKKGSGPNVGPKGRAEVRYTGKLVDGTQFDSSGDKTVTFNPSQVIRGFGEGLMLMNKGANYTLYIPADLAYGMQGPPAIGPAQTLIFEVEVVDVLPEIVGTEK